jgi:hypothetical protein
MDQTAKQQIVDRVKQAENILVTVSANPSVDQLAACIGLSLLLNKMGKSATAVFSGKVPSTIEFLQPEKNLETSTDSLRDFIISLDKAKADKLRYKIEDQVVRIFITPYKAKLSDKDLQFSEGDFNVEVIVTLGVSDRAHLDTAITAHGRILHDATVITLNTGDGKAPDMGQINWQDSTASSLSEMLVSLSEAFGPNLIDNQTATAFLTGIVSETERFSNKKTSPKVMTMSAQLMAAGANQQLVISKLEPSPPPLPPIPPPQPKPKAEPPKPPTLPQPPKPKAEPPKPEEEPKKDTGILNVAHENSESDGNEVEINTSEIHIDKQGNLKTIEEGQKAAAAHKDVPKNEKGDAKLPDVPLALPIPDVPVEPAPPAMPPTPPPPPPIPEQKPPEVIPPPPLPASPPPPPPVIDTPSAELPLPPSPKLADLETLPPLPSPPPTPSIKLEDHLPPHISAQSNTPPAPVSAPPPEHQHAVLDPLKQPPRMGASFSADTNDSWGGGSNNIPVDPVNNIPMNPTGQTAFGQAKQVAPPLAHQSPLEQVLSSQNPTAPPPPAAEGGLTPESARQAVESAFSSVPFEPANHPKEDLGAAPMGPELHPPTYGDGTPSLNLPGAAPGSASPVPPPPSPAAPSPPPPPGPPPFMPPPSL